MRDDNDVLITTIRVPKYTVPQVFLRVMNPDENKGGIVRVVQDIGEAADIGAIVDYLLEHLQPLEVQLEIAPKHDGMSTITIEVWLLHTEVERYIATHRPGALAEMVKELGQRAHKCIESINTMRSLEQ